METFFVCPIHLEDRLPVIGIPLLPGDPEASIDLQAVFDRCYDAGPYCREISYGEGAVIPPKPGCDPGFLESLARARRRVERGRQSVTKP